MLIIISFVEGTGSATLKTITDAVKPVKDEKDSRNNTWQLGLAYFF